MGLIKKLNKKAIISWIDVLLMSILFVIALIIAHRIITVFFSR